MYPRNIGFRHHVVKPTGALGYWVPGYCIWRSTLTPRCAARWQLCVLPMVVCDVDPRGHACMRVYMRAWHGPGRLCSSARMKTEPSQLSCRWEASA